MEANKVSKNGKAIVLSNGLEITYCEFGEQNDEVVLSGAFYFHTFTPVLEEMAKKYHVYGVVMRMAGDATEYNADGSVNWGCQWGKDMFHFARELGIKKFHYVGKCHGTNPGWYMVKEHPEMLDTFSSFYMAPHLCPRTSNLWNELPKPELMQRSMRKQENLPLKLAEVKTLGAGGGPEAGESSEVGSYGDAPERIWDSLEECEADMKAVKTPILFLFGTDDVLFHDYFDSNIKIMQLIPRAKSVLLQGERHLMEMDCAERMAREAMFFIEESKKNY